MSPKKFLDSTALECRRKGFRHMTTALNEWSKQDWKMIQCSRGVLKTLLNLKKERGRYHLRFDFKVWTTSSGEFSVRQGQKSRWIAQNYKKILILTPVFTNCRFLTGREWLTWWQQKIFKKFSEFWLFGISDLPVVFVKLFLDHLIIFFPRCM